MVALTTIFTPPSTCADLVTWDGSLLWQGGILRTNDPDCFPPAFASVFDSYYSPGICPSGWVAAGSLSGSVFETIAAETNALCCPRGYTTVFNGQPTPRISGIFCRTSFSGVITNVWSTSTLADGPAPKNPITQSLDARWLQLPYGWEDVIKVRWQSTDEQVMRLMSEASLEAAIQSTSTAVTSSAIPSSARPGATSSSEFAASTSAAPLLSSKHLSSGASAGIGIGAALGVLLVAAVGVWIFQRRRRHPRPENDDKAEPSPGHSPLRSRHGSLTRIHELSQDASKNTWNELDGTAEIYELGERRRTQELPG